MKAAIEWIVGVLRVGSDFKAHGDKYQAACTVIANGKIAILSGMSGELTRDSYEAISKCLTDAGFEVAEWDRMKEKKLKVSRRGDKE